MQRTSSFENWSKVETALIICLASSSGDIINLKITWRRYRTLISDKNSPDSVLEHLEWLGYGLSKFVLVSHIGLGDLVDEAFVKIGDDIVPPGSFISYLVPEAMKEMKLGRLKLFW